MAVKDSIFGSKSEERGFRSIEHTWGESYMLCPQVPLSALFTPNPNWRDTGNYFFKTSVDYVLCTDEGRPLLAIDFDGLGGGFDRDGEYVQVEATKDRYRKRKYDIKLRFSKENDFPYHIVSSAEFNFLGNGVELTVVDGIIGTVIAQKHFRDRAPSFLEEHAEEINSHPSWYKSEFVQDLLVGLEVDCDAEHNPIFRKMVEVMGQIEAISGSSSITGAWGYSMFEEPELPGFDWPPWENIEAFERRIEAWKKVEVLGCVVTISNTPVGEVSELVKVRNVAYSASLVTEIGQLMAWSKLLRLLRRRL